LPSTIICLLQATGGGALTGSARERWNRGHLRRLAPGRNALQVSFDRDGLTPDW